ncbi:MAG TPA: glycoside hydrolase [Fibrobacteria bacterium]|nr:glycoside hydrolase [Fibrobacteria bacterium]
MPYPFLRFRPASRVLAAAVLLLCFTARGQTKVTVNPGEPHQTFEGWGTSLCWWAHDLGTWQDQGLDALTTLVADTSRGLGMSIFRYNIGGGDQPGHNHMRSDGDVPGWKPTEAGPYDWNADAGQRKTMAFLRRKVPNPIWEAFSNSPPWWMTKSGCASGNNDGSNNLKEDYYDDFAEYLVTVTKHLQETDSVVIRTLTPLNEPNSSWWTAKGKQEGCMFSRATQPRILQEVGRRLKDAGLTRTSLSAADANSITEMVGNANSYDSVTLSYISQFNTHSYFGSDADRRSLADAAQRFHKKLWQSETGPLSWPGGNQFDVAMWSANLILRDLREMRAEAWVDWQVAGGGIWGVIDYSRSNQTSKMNKKGYAYAQFSRFIRPGSLIIGSDNPNTLAALVPATGSLVVVAVNTGSSASSYAFDLTRFQILPQAAQVYRTSASQDAAALADLPVSNKVVTVDAPSRTITTLILRGVVPSVSLAPGNRGRAGKRQAGIDFESAPAGWYLLPGNFFPVNVLGRQLKLQP